MRLTRLHHTIVKEVRVTVHYLQIVTFNSLITYADVAHKDTS
jgi:hypothetical protein